MLLISVCLQHACDFISTFSTMTIFKGKIYNYILNSKILWFCDVINFLCTGTMDSL